MGYSTVRERLDIEFVGGTYRQGFYVADVLAVGAASDGGVNICLGTNTFCAVFPVRSRDTCRLVGILPPDAAEKSTPTFDDIRADVDRLVDLEVESVQWFSTCDVHHRVAERFAVGRAFIAGDAGHVHSPAGGQGMNTGIGDAVNLAWKLASVLRTGAHTSLLDTYEVERIRFARLLVKTTDRAFGNIVGRGFRGRLVRGVMFLLVVPFATRFTAVRRAIFRMVSQIRVDYRHSPLSIGKAAKVRPGDRLPWIAEIGNFKPLESCDWQVHIYGEADLAVTKAIRATGIPVHLFDWCESAGNVGLKRNALYAIRPDGYIALVDMSQNVVRLSKYVSKFGFRARSNSSGGEDDAA